MTEERLAALAELAREGTTGWQGEWYVTEGWLAEMEGFVAESLKALPELLAEVRRLKQQQKVILELLHRKQYRDARRTNPAWQGIGCAE